MKSAFISVFPIAVGLFFFATISYSAESGQLLTSSEIKGLGVQDIEVRIPASQLLKTLAEPMGGTRLCSVGITSWECPVNMACDHDAYGCKPSKIGGGGTGGGGGKAIIQDLCQRCRCCVRK